MNTRKRIMSKTALGLLLAAAPLAMSAAPSMAQKAGIILAQAEKPEGMSEEAWRALLKKRQDKGEQREEAPGRERGEKRGEPKAPETPPAPEAKPEAKKPASAEERPVKPKVKPDKPEVREETPPAAPAEPAKPATPEPAPKAEEKPAQPEGATPAQPAEPAPRAQQRRERPRSEESDRRPEASQPSENEKPSGAQEAPAPEAEQPARKEASPEPKQEPREATKPRVPRKPAPAEQPAKPETPAESSTPEAPTPALPAPDAGNTPVPAPSPRSEGAPQEPKIERPADAGQEVLPENAAPVLDSQKKGDGGENAEVPASNGTPEATPSSAGKKAATPPPANDAEAQTETINVETLRNEIQGILKDQGQRIDMGRTREERRERRREMRQRPEGTEVVKQFNDNRTIIEINNQIFVESPDSDRLIRDRDEVYYEELPRGRVREVVTRPNGVKLITVRNRYGDVIRRVRVTPEGREQVLVFVPDERLDRGDRWRDPAEDLPPLRLTIPVSDYILEAERVEDPNIYYTFLEKPPVETVQRIYSLEEVKRSARVRDMVRRVDLDTIEFAFGSADIDESEIDELEAIATAIERMLKDNPAETFLIEGHTDAVGSDLSNLALSDRRAESVARALTDVFGIPPENLVTQGYGERYLKIDTQERERQNRRVALRRITPLVAPVASAN